MVSAGPELVPVSEFRRWSVSAAFPQIPSRAAFRVWRKMKQHPRFDGSDLTGQNGRSEREISGVEVQAGPGRPQRHERPSSLLPGRRPWRFRAVAELHATHDRGRFVNDDGAAALDAQKVSRE